MSEVHYSEVLAVNAIDISPNPVSSSLPPEFAMRLVGRQKRRLGDAFGICKFGVNIVKLSPGSMSSIRHCHLKQDEFIFVLEGLPTLNTSRGSTQLAPGMCAGFKSGAGDAHHLVNNSVQDVWYLEIGDRTDGDEVDYPDEDLKGFFVGGAWHFTRKNGTKF